MYIVKCPICGRESEQKQQNYIYCSDECREIGKKNQEKKWRKSRLENAREYYRKHRMDREVRCIICGQNVTGYIVHDRLCRPRLHDECIIAEIIITLKKGEKINTTQMSRIATRGITLRSIRKEMKANAD